MKIFSKRFVFSIIVGAGLLYYTLRFFDFDKTLMAIRQGRVQPLLFALALMVLAYVIRGKRWMIWEKDLKYWDSLKLILVGFMGNNILPARLGELLRAHCAAARIDNASGRTATLASIAIERILDGFVIALMGILGLALVSLDRRLFWALMLVCLLFFILTASLISGIHFHQRIRDIVGKIHQIFPGHITGLGREKINFFLDGLLLLRSAWTLILALIITGIIWGIELLAYFLIATSIFDGARFETCLIFLAVVNFSSLFPFTVGGIGAIEGATTPFLISLGIPANESLAMVLIQHGYQFFFITLTGGWFYFSSKYYEIPIVQKGTKAETRQRESPKSASDEDSRIGLNKLWNDLGIDAIRKPKPLLSVVIPAYNEKSRLPKTVLQTIKWCKENVDSYEIVIVDDGSTDETLEIGRLFSEYDPKVKVLANPHQGKGAAVRTGMLNSSGEYVIFMDADGATPLKEISKLRARIDEGYAIAIGSRVVQNPAETFVETTWYRKFIGRTFAAVVNVFGVSGIGDTQCGFKMFRNDVVKEIFLRQKIIGFAFDVELLFLANKLSFSCAEVPIDWINQEGSKVNLVLDSARMLRDVLRLRMLHRGI